MKTTTNTTPRIEQRFNPDLLLDALGHIERKSNKIITLSIKKIREKDVGKKKEFEKLLKEFKEIYERKKIKKAEYDATIKNLVAKRPCIPNAGGTVYFRRHKNP